MYNLFIVIFCNYVHRYIYIPAYLSESLFILELYNSEIGIQSFRYLVCNYVHAITRIRSWFCFANVLLLIQFCCFKNRDRDVVLSSLQD